MNETADIGRTLMNGNLLRASTHVVPAVCLALLGQGPLCRVAAAQSHIVEWEIAATVIDMYDPDDIFPDVQLGDPVRGFLRLDLSTSPELPGSEEIQFYFPDLEVVSMVIENPRTGQDTRFITDDEYFGYIEVDNDVVDNEVGEEYDVLFVSQSVLAPPGFTGTSPGVDVQLFGPANALPNVNLPAELNLDDWPEALMWFVDDDDYDFEGTAIIAEIYSLKLVETPPESGDFDADGDVDGVDFLAWQRGLGSAKDLSADGDGDGQVDAVDLAIWAKKFAASASAAANTVETVAAPEPAMMVLCVLGGVIATAYSRRRRKVRRSPQTAKVMA